ncbi:MAG: gluconeogenesis factor YvcK family protein [Chloroflexota bacterium]
MIHRKRFLARGPKIVAIGGGTGLSTLLRGLKEYTSNLTAVVTVADDGGSSGVLREELGIPAVGDIRNRVVALADDGALMGRLLQYRFPGTGPATTSPAEPDKVSAADAAAMPVDGPFAAAETGLGGHAVGNLLLAALVQLESGDFEQGVREMNRVLAVRGSVVPATGTVLTMHASLADGAQVEGQSKIAHTSGIERVWVTPTDVRPTEDALRAIADADVMSSDRAASTRACCPRCSCLGSARPSRPRARSWSSRAMSPPRRARRTGSTSRTTSMRSSSTAPATSRSRAREQPLRRRGPRGLDRRARAPPLAAEAPERGAPGPRRPGGRHQRPPPRLGQLASSIIRAWDREGGRRRRPGPARAERSA